MAVQQRVRKSATLRREEILDEAIRQIGHEVGRENVMYIHMTYVPFIKAAGEVKTKPSQQSVAILREIGIMADVLICRSEVELSDEVKRKLSLFCNVPLHAVIEERDVKNTIYEVPTDLSEQGLDELIMVHFRMARPPAKLVPWRKMIEAVIHPKGTVRIGVIGKYSELQDAYKSLYEAISHGGIAHQVKVEIVKIAAEEVESGTGLDALRGVDGILVPGGFGSRGIEGKIAAVRHARENNIPFFGICLGLQMAVIEFARNVAGLEGAHSTEIDPNSAHPVVALMAEQEKVTDMGATMRLGAWPCHIVKTTKAFDAYGVENISERHRHRYEVNNRYRAQLSGKGLIFSGVSPDGKLVEMIELENHPWFVGCQFHPELKSQPLVPHPLFRDFIGAAWKHKNRA